MVSCLPVLDDDARFSREAARAKGLFQPKGLWSCSIDILFAETATRGFWAEPQDAGEEEVAATQEGLFVAILVIYGTFIGVLVLVVFVR